MRLGLITIFVLLMAQGNAMEENNCVRWLDITVVESGQGYETKAELHADNKDCNLVTMRGIITTEIYQDDSTKKLVFSRDEKTDINDTRWDKRDDHIIYYCKYIPFNEFKNKISLDENGYAYIKIKMTYTRERGLDDGGAVYTDEETRIFHL